MLKTCFCFVTFGFINNKCLHAKNMNSVVHYIFRSKHFDIDVEQYIFTLSDSDHLIKINFNFF